MVELNITKKGEVIKQAKLPNSIVKPIVCGAIMAGIGAVGGFIGGFIGGVWEDAKCLFKKK